jgi:hypothetical protein
MTTDESVSAVQAFSCPPDFEFSQKISWPFRLENFNRFVIAITKTSNDYGKDFEDAL